MSTQPPIEDISAIVNRFQAWAGTQTAVRDRDGVRELTYDEAIRSRRFRVRVDEPLSETVEPVPMPVPEAEAAPVEEEKSARPKKSTQPSHRENIAKPGGSRRSSAAAPVAVSEPPVFQQVLAEKMSIVPAPPQATALAQRRTAALTLRVSTDEHTLLKQRATEANLSVSCYLRTCALEVEELRAQVNTLLAREAATRLPYRGSIFGGISRFVTSIFGGEKNALRLQA